MTLIYSIFVIFMQGYLTKNIAEGIIAKEKMHKTKEEAENALIRIMYGLGFVNCYLGLFYVMF